MKIIFQTLIVFSVLFFNSCKKTEVDNYISLYEVSPNYLSNNESFDIRFNHTFEAKKASYSIDGKEIKVAEGKSKNIVTAIVPENTFSNAKYSAQVICLFDGMKYEAEIFKTDYPKIAGLSSTKVKSGDEITISGQNIKPIMDVLKVMIVESSASGAVKYAEILSATNEQVKLKIPADVLKGKAKLVLINRLGEEVSVRSIFSTSIEIS